MKHTRNSRHRGFTLIETVIAIGVLAVLLTGFMVVFAPAADGIRKSISVQQADRMASTLEQELVTLHKDQKPVVTTGFNKSFDWIKNSDKGGTALMVYQYRGDPSTPRADDGTPTPVSSIKDKQSGKDYVVVSMMRRLDDLTKFNEDLKAVEGAVYLVKCTQLVFDTAGGGLKLGEPGKIVNPKDGVESSNADAYPEAVIAFSAEFFMMPAKSESYFTSDAFSDDDKFKNFKNPVFTRNLAVRR